MGVRTPTKSQNIGFLSDTGPGLLKNYKVTKPAFKVGPLSPHQLKNVVRAGPPLTKLSGFAHV